MVAVKIDPVWPQSLEMLREDSRTLLIPASPGETEVLRRALRQVSPGNGNLLLPTVSVTSALSDTKPKRGGVIRTHARNGESPNTSVGSDLGR